jgi:hypothetical protein
VRVACGLAIGPAGGPQSCTGRTGGTKVRVGVCRVGVCRGRKHAWCCVPSRVSQRLGGMHSRTCGSHHTDEPCEASSPAARLAGLWGREQGSQARNTQCVVCRAPSSPADGGRGRATRDRAAATECPPRSDTLASRARAQRSQGHSPGRNLTLRTSPGSVGSARLRSSSRPCRGCQGLSVAKARSVKPNVRPCLPPPMPTWHRHTRDTPHHEHAHASQKHTAQPRPRSPPVHLRPL